MRSIIGGYQSFAEAQRAVRKLEPQLSIQNVVIADRERSLGQALHPTAAQQARWHDGPPAFLVVLTAAPDVIAHATMLLREGG